MARTLAITNLKGGVGKSTTALNLAAALALGGERVLLVDVDLQGALDLWLDVTPRWTLYHVLAQETSSADAVIILRPHLDFLASGGTELAGWLQAVPSRAEIAPLIKRALVPLQHAYDWIVLDCGPGLDPLAIAAYVAADDVAIPVTPNRAGADGLEKQLRALDQVRDAGYRVRLLAVIPTMYDAHTREHRRWLEEFQEQIPEITAPIRLDIRLQEQPRTGKTIFEFAPGSRAAEDYAALAERIRYGKAR
jgi:chromosome partitioning protein